jgi:hypothetical protein
MVATHRARAILKIKRKNTASVEGRAKAFVAGAGGGTPPLASLAASVTAVQDQLPVLDKAEGAVRAKVAGAGAARNVQRNALVGLLETALALVQTLADAAASVDQAVALIQAAGMVVAIVPQRFKDILAAKQGPEAGGVDLVANATALGAHPKRKTCFNWQSTADGGKTYVTLPSTPTGKTSVAGLTPLTTYGFRVCVTGSDGVAGPWSQTIAFLVH